MARPKREGIVVRTCSDRSATPVMKVWREGGLFLGVIMSFNTDESSVIGHTAFDERGEARYEAPSYLNNS